MLYTVMLLWWEQARVPSHALVDLGHNLGMWLLPASKSYMHRSAVLSVPMASTLLLCRNKVLI